MSVSVRKYEDGKTKGYEVDVVARLRDGRTKRSRVRLADATKDAAVRWGQQRLTELLLHGGTKPKEVPTLAEFETRFVQEFAVANRQKPSTIASKKMILKKYLVPQLGRKRLDEIKHEDVQRLKAKLVHLNPKTVNCILTVLTKLLKVAVEWQVMEHCRSRRSSSGTHCPSCPSTSPRTSNGSPMAQGRWGRTLSRLCRGAAGLSSIFCLIRRFFMTGRVGGRQL